MIFLKKYCFLIFAICLSGNITGQSIADQIQFKVYGFEEGLSHRNSFKVTQDSSGFLWIATINGLNRFDSKKFLNYGTSGPDGYIPDNYVSDLCFESDSVLWLSLPDQLARLNTSNNYVKKIKVEQEHHTENEGTIFHSLFLDSKKNLWSFVYSSETGSSVLHKSNKEIGVQDIMSCKGTFAKRAIAELSGYIFFSYDANTLLVIDKKGEEVNSFKLGDGSSKSWVTQMQVTEDHTLWALMNNGAIYFIKEGSRDFELHPASNALVNRSVFSTFHVKENGNIWIGGMGNLWLYDALSKKTLDLDKDVRDITKYTVNYRDIFEDQTGVIWIATDFGLIKAVSSDDLFSTYMADGNEYCQDASCSVRGITSDENGNIYISYYNSIHLLNTTTNALRPLFQTTPFHNPPFGILYHKNAIWTGNGKRIDLNTMKIDTILKRPAPTDLGDVMVDHEGLLWFGYRNRIASYDISSKELTNFVDLTGIIDTQKIDISCIYQGKTGNYIWLGTLGDGLYKIDKGMGTLAHYHTENKNGPTLLHNKVNGVYEDRLGNLWIATGNGLHELNIKTEQISVYITNHGLANSFINGLLSEGDSAIWVSTDLGLSRFNIDEKHFINFNKDDGLSGNEFNRISFHQTPDGTMYFGGLHGVNAFKPGIHFLRQKEQQEGKILLCEFSKLDGEVDSLISLKTGINGQKINLSWRDKFFTFQFALANYANPGTHFFSYKLDGYEKEWSKESTINTARYNIVPHGDYIFRVRTKSGNGDWNKKELAIPIHIQQAFYKTWWFIAFCSALLLGALMAISQYSLYQARKRELKLKKEVHARTLDLEREMKKSDELLLNILPSEIAQELKTHGKAKAKRHENVTVFFSDFKGFTLISQLLEPEELVAEIDLCFREFDKIMEQYGLEKIKTIGDAYMCAGGIPTPDGKSVVNMIKAALDIQKFMQNLAVEKSGKNEPYFETRIGIHTGPLVSGIVGIRKFAYDIWGDTVNIAARLEDNGEVGKVNISQSTYELVKDHFHCTHRGKVAIKHEVEIDMYYVEGRKV